MRGKYTLRYIICPTFAALLTFSQLAQAEPSEPTYNLEIPANSAPQALLQLSKQTNQPLLFPYSLVEDIFTPTISGKYTLPEALTSLLSGSRLIIESNPSGGYRIIEPTVPRQDAQPIVQTKPQDETKIEIENDLPEIILVSGNVQGLSRALRKRRYATGLLESIYPEFGNGPPQQNIAEALQGLSGASTDNRRREGVFLSVRGFGPEFNTLLYNNRKLPNAGAGSGFSFDTLSFDMFAETEVHRTPSTELISGSIGAAINLLSHNPLTEGNESTNSLDMRMRQFANANWQPEISAQFAQKNERGAIFGAVNYLSQSQTIQSANTDGWFKADLSAVPNKSGLGDFSQAWVPRNFDLRLEDAKAKRLGLSLVGQFEVQDSTYLTADLLYAQLVVDSNITSSANWTHLNGAAIDGNTPEIFASVGVNNNNSLVSYRYPKDAQRASDFVQLTRNRPLKLFHTGLNIESYVGDNLFINADVSYGIARRDNGRNRRFSAVGAPNANPQYTYTQGESYASLIHQNPITIDDLRSHITVNTGADVEDRILQMNLNGKMYFQLPHLEKMDIGIYWSSRKKSQDAYRTQWGGEFGGYGFDLPNALFSKVNTRDLLNGDILNPWFRFNSDDYIDYLWSDENIENVIASGNAVGPSLYERRDAGAFEALPLPNNSWNIRERLIEAYIKFKYSGVLRQRNWYGNVGVRISHTSITAVGNLQPIVSLNYSPTDPTDLIIDYGVAIPVESTNSYFEVLPYLDWHYELNETQIIKFAISRTLARPALDDLQPATGSFVGRAGASTAVAGNSKLEPNVSTNVDIGWEWYFNDTGLFSLTLFYKRISNLIVESAQFENLIDHPEGEFLVVRPINADTATVSGLEFVYQNDFSQLPEPFNHLGIDARFTLIRDNDWPTFEESLDTAIEGLSDDLSLSVRYKQDNTSLALSYYFRDDFLRRQRGLEGQPEMVQAYKQLDFKASYQLSSKTSFYALLQNITDEPIRSYSIYTERLLSFEQREKNVSVGVQFLF